MKFEDQIALLEDRLKDAMETREKTQVRNRIAEEEEFAPLARPLMEI